MDARRRTRIRPRLIALVVMAGLAMPALALAAIDRPTPAQVLPVQVPPSDKPSPKPKPTPTPAPPTPTPRPTATPPASNPTPTPTPAPATPTPRPPTPAPATPKPSPTTAAPPAATVAPGTTEAPGPGATTAAGGPVTGTPGPSGNPLAPIGVEDPLAGGIPNDEDPFPSVDGGPLAFVNDLAAPLAYAAVVVLVAVAIARRRMARRERVAVAAAGVPDPDLRPVQRYERPPAPVVADDEASLPRWLRPSLRAERFGTAPSSTRVIPAALRAPVRTRTPLAFGSLPDDPDSRRMVRFDGVTLLDAPDEDHGRPLAQLESGDEIEVLDAGGDWVNILTPTGLAGWLPASRLGTPGSEPGPSHADQLGGPEPAEQAEPLDIAAIFAAVRSRQGSSDAPALPASTAGAADPEAPSASCAAGRPRRARRRPRSGTPSAEAEA